MVDLENVVVVKELVEVKKVVVVRCVKEKVVYKKFFS